MHLQTESSSRLNLNPCYVFLSKFLILLTIVPVTVVREIFPEKLFACPENLTMVKSLLLKSF